MLRLSQQLGRADQSTKRCSPRWPPFKRCVHTSKCAKLPVELNGLARTILAQPQLEGDPLSFLEVSEAYWKALRKSKHEPHKKGPTVVTTSSEPLGSPQYDVCICGGTLGVMLGLALQQRGVRVCIVERRLVQGRTQEWNTSRAEFQVLERLGLLTAQEIENCIVTEFNPVRVGFPGGTDIWVRDCLNIGVSPLKLVALLRDKFIAGGGVILENANFRSAEVRPDGVRAKLGPGGTAERVHVGDTNRPNALQRDGDGSSRGAGGAGGGKRADGAARRNGQQRQAAAGGNGGGTTAPTARPPFITARLLIDCMGHYSPIVKQMRGRSKPDGMCVVVGTCAEGVPAERNNTADLLYSMTDAFNDMQLFWEAFPAEAGNARTTYMFSYSDADVSRPSFEQLLDTYFELMPRYQGVPLETLRFKRVLFGGFPCYSNGPLQPAFDRVLQIGDASASQSPLSFGGFGCMLRHIRRLTDAVSHALATNHLNRSDLSLIMPYQPSLSASWLFQRSMSVGVNQLAASGPPQTNGLNDLHGNGLEDSHRPPATATPSVPSALNNIITFPAGVEQYSSSGDRAGCSASTTHAAVAVADVRTTREATAATAAAEIMLRGHGPNEPQLTNNRSSSTSSRAPDRISPRGTANVQQQQQQQQQNVPTQAAAAASEGPATADGESRSTRPGSSRVADRGSRQHSSGGGGWLPATHINEILSTNFGCMRFLGDRVLRPFLQDTIQLVPLTVTMWAMTLANPLVVLRVLRQVGAKVVLGWAAHYVALAAYTVGYLLLSPFKPLLRRNYHLARILEALQYGAAMDYTYHKPSAAATAATVKPAAAAANSKPADGVAAAAAAEAAGGASVSYAAAASRMVARVTQPESGDGSSTTEADAAWAAARMAGMVAPA